MCDKDKKNMQNRIKIGITRGDERGIGREIIAKVLEDKRFTQMCPCEIFDAQDDMAGIKSLDAAVEAYRAHTIDAIVTCPIDKAAAAAAGFGFVGHTEYFAHHFATPGREPLMFMIAPSVRVALVTKHVALENVTPMLSVQLVLDHLRSLRRSLEVDFLIRAPRIAVLGLNPHCGEQGMLGDQEARIISPAIDAANNEGILAFGPFAADGFFGSGNYAKFDAVLAMYHDQGLAPFKTIAFENGVNFTAGLPIVRTSPAHGVGLDIAGKDIADPSSLRAAIYAATDIVRARRTYGAMTANPLQKQFMEPDRGGRAQKDVNVDELFAEN